ncbi:hypothetical protein Pmani_037950 [Petrolisthes manimaculis]|uniref:Uncharacterized protein n=1 Tax=Petrolisthes manimaculis TaxID=1843537 RepID=A0AAE1NGP2_9EUCA|nr:hypothetical protein Pmani_037950 [Petrolisthes manimaculis]
MTLDNDIVEVASIIKPTPVTSTYKSKAQGLSSDNSMSKLNRGDGIEGGREKLEMMMEEGEQGRQNVSSSCCVENIE